MVFWLALLDDANGFGNCGLAGGEWLNGTERGSCLPMGSILQGELNSIGKMENALAQDDGLRGGLLDGGNNARWQIDGQRTARRFFAEENCPNGWDSSLKKASARGLADEFKILISSKLLGDAVPHT